MKTPPIQRQTYEEIMAVHREKIELGYKCTLQPKLVSDESRTYRRMVYMSRYERVAE